MWAAAGRNGVGAEAGQVAGARGGVSGESASPALLPGGEMEL